jgi:hypothetical protein
MINNKLIFLFGLIPFFFSCKSSNNEELIVPPTLDTLLVEETPKNEINTDGLREFSMADYELNTTIYIPELYYKDDEDLPRFTPPDIIHNDGEARWEIKVPGNKYWHLVIEDMGKESFGVKKELEEHEYQKVIFDFKYHEQTDNTLLYSKILKSGNTTLDDKAIALLPNYHFYCAREINGSHIVFRSHEMVDFRKPTINKMMASALSAK